MLTLRPIFLLNFWLCCPTICVYTCTVDWLWLYSCPVTSMGPDQWPIACFETFVYLQRPTKQLTNQHITEFKMVCGWTIIKHELCKRSWCYTIDRFMQQTAPSTLVPILLLCTLTVTVLYSLYSIRDISKISSATISKWQFHELNFV